MESARINRIITVLVYIVIISYFDARHSPRQIQIDALNWLDSEWNNHRIFALSAPCGTGKTFVSTAIADCLASQGKTCAIITPQRQLQNQIAKDMPHINMLKGADNYQCIEYPKETVDAAKALDLCKTCDKRNICP